MRHGSSFATETRSCASAGLRSTKSSVPLRTCSITAVRLGLTAPSSTPLSATNQPRTSSISGKVQPSTAWRVPNTTSSGISVTAIQRTARPPSTRNSRRYSARAPSRRAAAPARWRARASSAVRRVAAQPRAPDQVGGEERKGDVEPLRAEQRERLPAAVLPQHQLDREREQEAERQRQRDALHGLREEVQRDQVTREHRRHAQPRLEQARRALDVQRQRADQRHDQEGQEPRPQEGRQEHQPEERIVPELPTSRP